MRIQQIGYDDFIEMGIAVEETLQPWAKDMAPELLKRTFGGWLAFHGCISTAVPVATGTVRTVWTASVSSGDCVRSF